jgi:hypothetical protein
MIKSLEIVTVVWVKNTNIFAKFFGKNILKIITLIPGANPTTLRIYSGNGSVVVGLSIFQSGTKYSCFRNALGNPWRYKAALVKIYNATNSIALSIVSYLKNALAVNLKDIKLAPGVNVTIKKYFRQKVDKILAQTRAI